MRAQPEAEKYYFYINILRIKVYILNMTLKKSILWNQEKSGEREEDKEKIIMNHKMAVTQNN